MLNPYKMELPPLKPFLIAVIVFVLLFLYIYLAVVVEVHGEEEISVAGEVDTTHAVIHHTASKDVSIDVIRKYHVETKGFDDVGYHFLIRTDGTVEKGRRINKIGAHAKGRNHYVGIALTGYDKFTLLQKASLLKLLKRLKVTHVEPHHEKCPGKGIDIEKLNRLLTRF